MNMHPVIGKGKPKEIGNPPASYETGYLIARVVAVVLILVMIVTLCLLEIYIADWLKEVL